MKTTRLAVLAAFAALAAMFPSSLSAAPVSSSSAGYRALKAPAPAWYTPELHQQVMAAGVQGIPLPSGVEIPASATGLTGIGPSHLIIVGGTICSSNFVFRNGSNFAIGTAGHCGTVGQPVVMLVAQRALVNIGTVTKSTNGGIGNDFALISIKPELNNLVSPSIPYWGGPTGVWPGPRPPAIVKHVGWGLGIGTGGTPRIGIGTYFSSTAWRMLGVITGGDSGSAAIAKDGRALGNITHINCCIDENGVFTVAGTSITRILQIAGLPLATCPRLPGSLRNCPL